MKTMNAVGFVPGRTSGGIAQLNEFACSSSIVMIDDPNLEAILRLGVNRPAGAVLIAGARFSHLSIYLCSLNLPTVIVSPSDFALLRNHERVLLDGFTGQLVVDPDAETIREWQESSGLVDASSVVQPSESAYTQDGVRVTVAASVSGVNAAKAKQFGADEVGLLRSEFLFGAGSDPTNFDQHREALAEVCDSASPLLVKIRLFDLGAEKLFSWTPRIIDADKTLGVRGARMYRYDEFRSVLRCQLHSIAALTPTHKVAIIVPFVTTSDEFRVARAMIQDTMARADISIGAMIEIPSLCLSLPELVGAADFVALGTNDLMQCFYAADRGLRTVASYLEPYTPALLRFLSVVQANARDGGIPVQICGQLSLYPYMAPLLIGLGYRSFSVEPYVIPHLKTLIRSLDTVSAGDVAEQAQKCRGTEHLKEYLLKALGPSSQSGSPVGERQVSPV